MAEPQDAVVVVVDGAEEAAVPGAKVVENERARPPVTPTWASSLLRDFRAAPIRVRCFGASEVWHGDRLLKIGDPELLWLLAVVGGVSHVVYWSPRLGRVRQACPDTYGVRR